MCLLAPVELKSTVLRHLNRTLRVPPRLPCRRCLSMALMERLTGLLKLLTVPARRTAPATKCRLLRAEK